MSYLDPQSWDDVDSAGNPLDWSSREGKLYYPAYEMLNRAMAERHRTPPPIRRPDHSIYRKQPSTSFSYQYWRSAWDFSLYYRPWNVGSSGAGQSNTFRPFMDNAIADYTGYTTAPSIFTMETMLNAIGDSEFVTDKRINGWALQRYKMLNKMLWVLNNKDVIRGVTGEGGTKTKIGQGATWGEALANYNAASWGGGSNNTPGHSVTFSRFAFDLGYSWAITIERVRSSKFTTSLNDASLATNPLLFEIQSIDRGNNIIRCHFNWPTPAWGMYNFYFGWLHKGDSIIVDQGGVDYVFTLSSYPTTSDILRLYIDFTVDEVISSAITTSAILKIAPTAKTLRKMDLYIRFNAPSGGQYVNNDYTAGEGQFIKLWNNLTESQVNDFYVGGIEACTLPAPDTAGPDSKYGWASRVDSFIAGWRFDDSFLIEKLDTPGVLRFQP